MAAPDFRWGRLLLKLALIGGAIYYFGAVVLIGLALLLVLAWLVSKILPQNFLSSVAVELTSFLLTRKLLGPAPTVPVRDIRVRDSAGQEVLVRLKGQLISGSISVGDDVVVEGWDRNGMLLFRRGYNKRIRTTIKVKHQ